MPKKATTTTAKTKEPKETKKAAAQKTPETKNEAPGGAQVQLMKIYVKDASLQIPLGVKAFRLEWTPELNVEINTQSKPLAEQNIHEAALKIKCTVKCKNEVAFIAEVDQAGLFMVNGLDEASLRHALGAFCPNILYPFLREAIGDMVLRAGFPQLNLAPINFDVLYQQQTQTSPIIQ
jgi:preprotein translocase subunit SecB